MIREAWEEIVATGDRGFASTVAGELAFALIELDDMDEAERYAKIASEDAASDDFTSQILSQAAMGRVLASRGLIEEGERLVRQAVDVTTATDYLTYQGATLLHLAAVLNLSDRRAEADATVAKAIERFGAKGATAWVRFAESQRAKFGPAASAGKRDGRTRSRGRLAQ